MIIRIDGKQVTAVIKKLTSPDEWTIRAEVVPCGTDLGESITLLFSRREVEDIMLHAATTGKKAKAK